jgi:hypothetical protein
MGSLHTWVWNNEAADTLRIIAISSVTGSNYVPIDEDNLIIVNTVLYKAQVTTKYSEMGSISHLIVFHTILED